MAARAPLRAFAPDSIRHQLDALPIEGIVERREPMRRAFPLMERVGVAGLAVVVRRELLRVEEPLIERLRGGREEHGVAVHVDDALGRLLEFRDDAHRCEEDDHGASPGIQTPELELVGVRPPVKDKRDERQGNREDVSQPDRPMRERSAFEDHERAGDDAHDGENEDREARILRPLVPHPDHSFRVRDCEDEEGDRDRDAQHEVQQQHRVEEAGVSRETVEVDCVRRDQPQRNQKEPVEPSLPGAQDTGRLCGRVAHVADSTQGRRRDDDPIGVPEVRTGAMRARTGSSGSH